ncbi:Protein of unknown function, partial [Gryllus bimaculatus]
MPMCGSKPRPAEKTFTRGLATSAARAAVQPRCLKCVSSEGSRLTDVFYEASSIALLKRDNQHCYFQSLEYNLHYKH